MALLLSLETSTDVCSAALFESGSLVKEIIVHEPQAHASKLAPIVDEIFKNSSRSVKNLTAVAIAKGPGSYTGLRIGTSTAKGLCFALNIPLITVGTLDVIAHQALKSADKDSVICPMIDARRMEVYCQLFDNHLKPLSDVEAKIIDSSSFQELLLTRKVFFCGNGSNKCREAFQSANAYFLEDVVPSAASVGTLAYEKLLRNEVENLMHFEPFYLKQFEAKKSQSQLI